MRLKNRNKYLSAIVSLLIIVLLITSSPVMAVSTTVSTDKSSYNPGESINITSFIETNTNELIPLKNMTVKVVRPSGSTVSAKDLLVLTNQDSNATNDFGSRIGYLATNKSGSWIYYTGNGSGFGYGYGYEHSSGSSGSDATIYSSYSLSSSAATGTYTVYLQVYDTDGTLVSESSTTFTVQGGGGGGTTSDGSYVIEYSSSIQNQLTAGGESVEEINQDLEMLDLLGLGLDDFDQEAIDDINDLLAQAEEAFAAGRLADANALIAEANALIAELEVPDVELESSVDQEFTLDLTDDDVSAIEQALSTASPEIAGLASVIIEQSNNLQSSINVDAHVDTYSVTDPITGTVTHKSVIKKTITNTEGDLLELNILMDINKEIAPTVEDITFDADANILVIEADPVVLWLVDSLGAGETAELTYTVDGEVDEAKLSQNKVNFFSTAGIQITPEPTPISDDTTIGTEEQAQGITQYYPLLIGLIIAVIIIAGILFLKRRGGSRKPSKSLKKKKKNPGVIKKKEDDDVKTKVEVKMGRKKIFEDDMEDDLEDEMEE